MLKYKAVLQAIKLAIVIIPTLNLRPKDNQNNLISNKITQIGLLFIHAAIIVLNYDFLNRKKYNNADINI